jgi:soluble lytic murein transglycosylase-like protein
MQHRRFGSLAAALLAMPLAFTATAFAATPATPPSTATATPALTSAPAGCTRAVTVAQHRRYAKRVFKRATISHKAKRHLSRLRHCQKQGQRAIRATRRTERKLKHWRSLYHCTQSKVVNCIRDATRIYGGSVAHNLACAKSESGLNPYARNGGGSGASGLFQFMPSTWSGTLSRMGVRRARSIYSAKWQARAAAWKFRHDGFGEWSGAGC